MQEGGERGQKISAEGTVRLSADISRAGAFSECGLGNSSIGQQGRPLPQQLCEFRCSGEGAFGPGGGRGTCAWSREIAPEQLGGDLLRLITHGYADITRIRFPVVVFHRRVAFAQMGVFLFLQRLLDNRLFGEVCHLALQEYVDEVGILVGRRDPEVYRGGRQIRGLDRDPVVGGVYRCGRAGS